MREGPKHCSLNWWQFFSMWPACTKQGTQEGFFARLAGQSPAPIMIPHTKAFKRLKDEAQNVFNFAIVVCYAVPSLKFALKDLAADAELPFLPDHFDARPIAREKVLAHAREYKEVLSRYIFLSAFSYFEAYFVDLLAEILAFHGGEDLLKKYELARNVSLTNSETNKAKKKLSDYRSAKNADAYTSAAKHLRAHAFVFPTAALARHGLKELLQLISSDYIRAANIPDLVESVLQLTLDAKTEKERFHGYRDMRNKIAHGRPDKASVHLSKAIEANNFLRNLALKIDRHVVDNLLLIEP
jgi:hypothetical protein